ncbi:MAG TPA: hypothetical protein VL334_24310 [Anaerolineae bacterium]|nr:hypothetical protein [Anaerolineae bacterium]
MASNRETARDALAALIDTAMVGTGKPVEAVYHYLVSDLAGQSPVVCVTSAGSLRVPLTRFGSRAEFLLRVDVFVLYNDQGGWTEADAEDRLDLIEATLATLVDANQQTAPWQALSYAEPSSRTQAVTVLGGESYAWEAITLRAEVYG